jgi:hypothetical protein
VHGEEMLYGLFEIGSLENLVDWVGFVMGEVHLCMSARVDMLWRLK